MKLLVIETTCDETAAAVVAEPLTVLSSVVASQDELHRRFGGVVPEIASRAHVERILPVVELALERAQVTLADIDAVAVANTPGLAGSLLVGLAAAKALCVATGKPLVAVNHLQAHIYACQVAGATELFPCVGLIVSGGHSSLYRCTSALDFTLLGGTIDDAAGEAFDKVASLLGLPYPGGPSIERAATGGNHKAYAFPRAFKGDRNRLAFSFSGLKTAVRYQIAPPSEQSPAADVAAAAEKLSPQTIADLAASFQEAVVETLVDKSLLALETTGLKILAVGGGVAANSRLRQSLEAGCRQRGYRLHIAPKELCTDNAVMGAIGLERLKAGLTEPLTLDIIAGLVR
ncbi:MAG TPA: tRNA (adenosine(37)-N6)-threonylcarbamoyltransferase complex transferase subunit TsaD [Pirellulales bacterium]